MEQVAKVDFHDLGENCPGFVITRAENGIIAFAVALETNGDIDVAVTPSDARAIAKALLTAADHAEGGK